MSREYKIRIWEDTGIPEAMRKYCKANDMKMAELVRKSIAEKLERMDVHSLSIAEIEAIDRGDKYEL